MRSLSKNKTSSLLQVLALGALALTAGCRIEKPATVVPAAPAVTSFTASATEVAPGTQVTLTWATSDATSIELRSLAQGPLTVDASTTSGSFAVVVDEAATFVLVARGPGGSDARALSVTTTEGGAAQISFTALPPEINGGGEATLVWTAPGARNVSLTAGGQAVDVAGQRGSGAVNVSPRFDTTYTLTADGVSRTATVSVSPVLLSTEVAPRSAVVGEPVSISWAAAGAERVQLSSPGRGLLFETTTASEILSGSFSESVPPAPNDGVVTYELAAIKGATRDVRTLVLNVGTGLAITRFVAPPVAAAGAAYAVRWETRAADQVEVKVDGVTVYVTGAKAVAAAGAFSFTAPAADFAVQLVASDARGGRDTQQLQVDSVGVPSGVTLSAAPSTVAIGQPVTLTWASLEARRVRITDASGQVVFSLTGQPAEGGSALVYPDRDTTYTISADNLLGNPAVSATAAVTVTGASPLLTQFPPTAISGQNVDVGVDTAGAVLSGFPHAQELSSSLADFIDISTTGTRQIEGSGNTAQVMLPFSTMLWGERKTGSLTISRAGWMAWGASASSAITSNATSLPSTSGPGGLIAPFWDDLQLIAGTSAVYTQLIGNAPDESLVVQWDKMRVGTSAGTEVTMQVRVHQRGMVSFHYKTVSLPSSPSFVIGLQNPTQQVAFSSTVAPASNSARYFFSPVTPPITVRALKGASVGGYVKVGSVQLPVAAPLKAVDVPGDLTLSELMFRPSPALPNGQYVEIYNRSTSPLDLTGWQMRSTAGTPFSVSAGFTVAAGAVTLVGASTDGAENDDAGVSVSWGSSGFTMSQDAGTLLFGTADASVSFPYAGPADGGRGIATEVETRTLVGRSSSLGVVTCPASTAFGTQSPQQLGSPGRVSTCFPYDLQPITAHFVDISDGGTRLVNSTSAVDTRVVPITLAATAGDPAPFAFGERRPEVSMSVDGWLTWGNTTSSDCCNSTTISTTVVGKVAPFWDDLQTTLNVSPTSDLFWKQFAVNEDPVTPARHWVFQWSNVRHYATSPADSLNFEVKLFEDGTIEYHYGSMTSGTTDNYATGNSASMWLENPGGTLALPISINTAGTRANTAYRFVPR